MDDALHPHILACLRNGPLVALVDPAHPEVSNLPDFGQRVLLIRVDTEEARAALEGAAGSHFPWRYADRRGETATARIPWAAVLGLSGTHSHTEKQRLIAVRNTTLPSWLGPDGDGALRRVFVAIGKADPDPRPLWRFEVGIEGTRPSKPGAVEALAAGPRLVALIRPQVPGFMMDPALSGDVTALTVGLAPSTLKTTDRGLEARFVTHTGSVGGFLRVPWEAIGAVQDPTTGQGWFWPADLPTEAAAGLELAPQDVDSRGHPLAPPTIAPFFELPAPRERDKRKALIACQRRGGALLLINPQAAGAQVPGNFAGLPFLVVPLALPAEVGFSNLKVTGLHIQTDLPDFDGVPRRLTLPWNAIFAITNAAGAPAMNAWPRDYPAAIREAFAHWPEDAPTAPLGEEIELPPGHEPAWAVDTRDGYPAFAIRQPLGPVDGESRPALTLEVRLPTG